MAESHAHGEDTWPDTAVVRHLIADDGAACGIHDEPDVGFHAANFDVGFISDKNAASLVIMVINKRFYADSGSLAVVGDLLVGNADVVKVFESL